MNLSSHTLGDINDRINCKAQQQEEDRASSWAMIQPASKIMSDILSDRADPKYRRYVNGQLVISGNAP